MCEATVDLVNNSNIRVDWQIFLMDLVEVGGRGGEAGVCMCACCVCLGGRMKSG